MHWAVVVADSRSLKKSFVHEFASDTVSKVLEQITTDEALGMDMIGTGPCCLGKLISSYFPM